MQIGRRHLPAGAAFPNGPNWGRDVVIPMDYVIGGEAMAGQGWRMLMECLAAGRAISLPSSATAGTKMMLRVSSAYARIRKQFGLPIGRMEGVEEPLARLVESAYATEAARGVTAAMVSRGERPSVISALMKYSTTERMRRAVNDAFDIHGGRAICDGPTNYLQSAYQMVPVGITVEGANILTRTLITFAQGALRSHPYLYREIQAAQNPDAERGLDAFDRAFGDHVAFSVANACGGFFHNLTGGLFAAAPEKSFDTAHWYRQLGPLLAQLRLRRRSDGGLARRQPEDQAEAIRPARGRAVGALHPRLRVEALRGRRAPVERPHVRRSGGHERPLSLSGSAARRRRQFPRRAGALGDAHRRLPARQSLSAGARLPWPSRRQAWCSRPRRCASG